MQEHYFDYSSLKQDLIDAIESVDENDPESSQRLVAMYEVLSGDNSHIIHLHHNDIKEYVEYYRTLQSDLDEENAEEIPSGPIITQIKQEMENIKIQLMKIAKIKVQQESGFNSTNNVEPHELVTYWLGFN